MVRSREKKMIKQLEELKIDNESKETKIKEVSEERVCLESTLKSNEVKKDETNKLITDLQFEKKTLEHQLVENLKAFETKD